MKIWLILILSFSSSLFAKTEILFWHAFEGFLYERFAEIVNDFNEESKDYHVELVYKGNYTQTYNQGIEAFKKGNPPHILFVYEVATQTMMLHPEMFLPVDELMSKHYKKFDQDIYIGAVRDFYSTADGKMCSLPWNASTGILYYNKKAFEAAGLDPEKPPRTWEEMESFGEKLVEAGYTGFTTAWPAAYHLELFSSWHNLPYATLDNGFGGLAARLDFAGPYQLRHISKLVEWQQNGIFSYQGRFTNEPEKLFTEGKAAILLQGANRYPTLAKNSKDPIGVGFMPYWSDIPGAPYKLNIGGASFWAVSGFDEKIYRGIAQFFSYLSSTEVQAEWHQKTGYLPITEAAYYLTKKKGFYETHPAVEIAVLEVINQRKTPYTKGIRLGNYLSVREKVIDGLEKAFSQELSVQEALERAIIEGNKVLAEFEEAAPY
jgi:sn-glycerol 3-phosphate transport system substrate-binding protein